jgi:ABC-type transport system substrate-binding protein
MRRTTIVLACAIVAPLAFAQTRTAKTRYATTTQPATTQMTTGAVAVGTVTAFTPGKTTVTPPSPIVVQSSPDAKPMSYVLGRKVRYVAKDGKAIDPHMIRAGTRVHLDFDRRGAVKRVVVYEKQ